MVDTKIINRLSYGGAAELHAQDKQAWANFARRCIKNPYMMERIMAKSTVCAWCRRPFGAKPVVGHHMDYDHACRTDETVRVPHPTEKRPDRTTKVPDCETCARTCPDAFSACLSRIVPVHQGCNGAIAMARLSIYGTEEKHD